MKHQSQTNNLEILQIPISCISTRRNQNLKSQFAQLLANNMFQSFQESPSQENNFLLCEPVPGKPCILRELLGPWENTLKGSEML